MFKLNNVGKKLYFSVLAVFLVFAVSFIVFQQTREKQYKISTLTLKLANYNELLAEDLELSKTGGILLSDSVEVVDSVRVAEAKLEDGRYRFRSGNREKCRVAAWRYYQG